MSESPFSFVKMWGGHTSGSMGAQHTCACWCYPLVGRGNLHEGPTKLSAAAEPLPMGKNMLRQGLEPLRMGKNACVDVPLRTLVSEKVGVERPF